MLAVVVAAGSVLSPVGGAWAVTRVSVADGPWCADATWYPPGVPEATDRVQILAGHRVLLDGACVQVAADLTTHADPRWTDPMPRGTLASAGGQTLRIGDPLDYAIENFGSIELGGGDRLEIDCDSTWTPSCTVRNRPGSRFVARGARLGTGVVTAVSGENCPANSDFRPEAPFQASDCTDVAIEVEGLGAVEDGDPRFVGRFIRFGWPSAHRGTWYSIVGASAPNRLTLDYNSEGQQAARGVGPATATAIASVAQGSTSVAWPGGLEGADALVSIGAWFVCDDDCPAVANDSPFPGASLERLPCASARRILDVPMTCDGGLNPGALCPGGDECIGDECSAVSGHLWLDSGYPTATCADGGAARIIGSSAGNGYAAVDYVERFAAGDPFVVWDPVTLTVPVENRQFASTQDKTVGGLHIEDDSVVDLEGVRISFWGRGDSGILPGYDPIQTNFTPANSSGALYLRHVEIAHFGGGEAVNYRNVKNGLGANEDVTVRDPLPTDQGVNPSRGHGVWLNEYDYAGGNGVAVIARFRGTRLGDDCIVVNAGSTSAPDAHDFARITLDHPTCTFASTLARQPSAQCFDFQDPALRVRDGVDLIAPLCSNYQNGGFWWANSSNGAATSGRFLVSDGVFQNLQEPCLSTTTRSDYDALRVVMVNSLCRALPAHTAQPGVTAMGSYGADVFSSYFADATRGIADADVVKGAFVRLGYRNGASGLYTGMSEPENFTASDQTYEDVAVSRVPCPPDVSCAFARGFEVDSRDPVTSDLALTHGTFAGLATNTGGVACHLSDNPTALATVRDSVVSDIRQLFVAAGPAQTLTESNNLFLNTDYFCTPGGAGCPARSPTTLSSGVIAVRSPKTGDLTPLPGTTPFTMETTDATPAGARAAGPASWARLERVHPPLAALGRPGVRIPAYAVDGDADGLFDLHDECPTVPFQALRFPGVPGDCTALDSGCSAELEGVPTACGVGECASTGVCTNGADTCLPGVARAEACDGQDNDCNGLIDEADADGDSILDCSDDCPSVPNADQADGDSDGVGDLCDNCSELANPRVSELFLTENPWATLTGGQRDDDHDGFGNACDADFDGAGTSVGGMDLGQMRASQGRSRADDTCGTLGTSPCAIFDLDGKGDVIGGPDLGVLRALTSSPPGPKCPTCPLACAAGADGSCE